MLCVLLSIKSVLASWHQHSVTANVYSLAFAEGGDDPSGADPLDMLMKAVPGIPGEDYPIFAEAPETSFSCDGQVNGGKNHLFSKFFWHFKSGGEHKQCPS